MKTLIAIMLAAGSVAASAQVTSGTSPQLPSVEQAWVRASVPGQRSTGAFMRVTAHQPMRLVAVSTPVGVAELHEMRMDGDVMRMRPLAGIDLPVGRAFEFKPGAHHVMLQELKTPVVAGSTVPLTLHLRNARGVDSRLELQVPVTAAAPPAANGGSAASSHSHDHKH